MHSATRVDRNHNATTTVHPTTFTKLGNVNGSSRHSGETALSPKSIKVPLFWSQSLHRNGLYSTSSLDGRFSDGELGSDHQGDLERIEKRNLKMEGQLLQAFKSSHNNLSRSGELAKAKPPHYNTLEQSSLLKRRLSKINPSSPSGWPNNLLSKSFPAQETVETNSIKLVPIGIQSLESSAYTLNFPDVDKVSRVSRSRSLSRGQKDTSEFCRSSSQERKETRNSRRADPPSFDSTAWMHSTDTNNNIAGKMTNSSNGCGDIWYKPNFSREFAARHLLDKPSGSFVVRKSSTHPGSYALVLKANDNPGNRMPLEENQTSIRHFLIDPTARGIQLRGYKSEPEFASLKDLVEYYKMHLSALPCRLSANEEEKFSMHYIKTISIEMTVGLDAMKRAFDVCLINSENIQPKPIEVQLNWNGICIMNLKEKISALKNCYSYREISFCCIDPYMRKFPVQIDSRRQFMPLCGFLTRSSSFQKKECHVFSMRDLKDVDQFLHVVLANKESEDS